MQRLRLWVLLAAAILLSFATSGCKSHADLSTEASARTRQYVAALMDGDVQGVAKAWGLKPRQIPALSEQQKTVFGSVSPDETGLKIKYSAPQQVKALGATNVFDVSIEVSSGSELPHQSVVTIRDGYVYSLLAP